MPLTKPQQTVFDCNRHYRVLITGRRFGKTMLCISEMCRVAAQLHKEVWYVAPTYGNAKRNMWRPLKAHLLAMNWVKKINESELYVDLKSGSRISLKGAENYDALRGSGIDLLVVDEVADVNPAAFWEVLSASLADRNGKAFFVGTPKGMGNWAYDLYQMQQRKPKLWSSFTYTTEDGGFVTKEFLDQQRAINDERTFNQEYMADFVTSGNRVWYNFHWEESVRPYSPPTEGLTEEEQKTWNILKAPPLPKNLSIGMDFNIDPMTAVVFARHGDIIYAVDEIHMNSSNTDEMVQEIKNRYENHKITVYPDPACRQRKTSAGGMTDLKILQNAGFRVKAKRKHELIRDGVNAVNSKLMNSLGSRTFFIDPKCTQLIKCLDRHQYKEGTTVPDKTKGFDHMTDAMRYYIDYEFPVRIDQDHNDNIPQRWGHAIGE